MQTEGTETQGRRLSKEGVAGAQAEQQGQLRWQQIPELVWSANQRPGVQERAGREGALRGKWERRNGGPKPS